MALARTANYTADEPRPNFGYNIDFPVAFKITKLGRIDAERLNPELTADEKKIAETRAAQEEA